MPIAPTTSQGQENFMSIKLFYVFVIGLFTFGGYQAWKHGYINLDAETQQSNISIEEIE